MRSRLLVAFLALFQFVEAQTWTTLGSENNIPGGRGELLVSPGGELYVGTFDPKLFKWSGSEWLLISEDFITDFDTSNTQLDYEISSTGDIYVSSNTNIDLATVRVQKFSGSEWSEVLFKPVLTGVMDLAPDRSGLMYLGVFEKIYFFGAGTLDSLEAPQGYFPSTQENSLVFNPQNELFLANLNFFSQGIQAYKRTGNTWFSYPIIAVSDLCFPQLKIHGSDGLKLLYTRFIEGGQTSHFLKLWDGNAWQSQPDSLFLGTDVPFVYFELDGDGNPLVDNLYGKLFRYKSDLLEELPQSFQQTQIDYTLSAGISYNHQQQRVYQLRNQLSANTQNTTGTVAYLSLIPQSAPTIESPTISVFPNPSSGLITILNHIPTAPVSAVEVLNVLGESVYKETINHGAVKQIDLSHLSSGIYWICFSSYTGVFKQEKLCISRN
jgi:hypothetical protein